MFKQSNVDAINIDERIATKAGEIREYYIEASKKDGKPSLGFADVLHLATAIVQEATVFHTFDDSDKNHRGLLGLTNNVAGHPLLLRSQTQIRVCSITVIRSLVMIKKVRHPKGLSLNPPDHDTAAASRPYP